MFSELLTKKFTRYFHVRDVNKNGVVEQADYEQFVHQLAEIKGLQLGSPEYEELESRYLAIWTTFWKPADLNGDGQVSLDEFLEVVSTMIPKVSSGNLPSALAVGVSKHEGLFSTLDLDGDGRITLEEYKLFFRCCGLDEEEAVAVFPRLDLNGDGHIDKEEFLQLCLEFYIGDDPQAPGNWLFGPY